MSIVAMPIPPRKRIALVAHDNKKKDLMEWAKFNRGLLLKHELCATGTTGTSPCSSARRCSAHAAGRFDWAARSMPVS